ncbi:hypothetical protein LOD99_9659 [Oopsacas minuta]|uniref:Uncharacterized protein n=1 Tax=Oopsacas minuta TaxID=111878 RepID=A0AAV7KR28_9METZ|nr:hypothetical protein LOD99_9659 [Oopsacas minuta]
MGHGTMIGRVYSAHPIEGERFNLRILLHHVTGCRSYKDIQTLPDGLFAYLKEASRRRGLFEDDQECDNCLTEADLRSSELRQLFVTLLIFNEPADPLVLLNKHKASLAEDFLFFSELELFLLPLNWITIA